MAHVAIDAEGFIVGTHKGLSAHNPLECPEGGSLGTCSDKALEKIVEAWDAGKRARFRGDIVMVKDAPKPKKRADPVDEIDIEKLKLTQVLKNEQTVQAIVARGGEYDDDPRDALTLRIRRLEKLLMEKGVKDDDTVSRSIKTAIPGGVKVTLVAAGGGLDSTGVLYELLKNTADEVRAVFLDMSEVEYQHPQAKKGFWSASSTAEGIAVARVHEWLAAHVRDYELKTIKLASSSEARAPAVIRMGAGLVEGCDRFIFCRTPEQTAISGPMARNSAYYKRIWSENAPKGIPMEWPLIAQNKGRPHAIAELPAELQALTSSCLDPAIIDGIPVRDGVCPKCLATDAAKKMHREGVDPDVALDFLMQKIGAGPYVGAKTVDRRYQSARVTDQYDFLRSPEN